MASFSAANQSMGGSAQLCGNSQINGQASVISFADLGLPEPESDLPEPHQCECELSAQADGFIDAPRMIFGIHSFAIRAAFQSRVQTDIQKRLRAAYLSRGPPVRA